MVVLLLKVVSRVLADLVLAGSLCDCLLFNNAAVLCEH